MSPPRRRLTAEKGIEGSLEHFLIAHQAAILATKKRHLNGGLVIFGLSLYRVIGLVVDDVDQYHIGDSGMNLTQIRVCYVVDCLGPKVDEPNQSRERVRSLKNPLGLESSPASLHFFDSCNSILSTLECYCAVIYTRIKTYSSLLLLLPVGAVPRLV